MKMDFNELKTTITENESKNILNMFEMLLKSQELIFIYSFLNIFLIIF